MNTLQLMQSFICQNVHKKERHLYIICFIIYHIIIIYWCRIRLILGYYPILDRLCFIRTNNASLSPKDMCIPVEKFIDFIIDNIDPSERNDDIDSRLIKFFSFK